VTQHDIIKTAKIRSIQWDDDYVIYDQLSGDTHLLDAVSGELICALSEQAMSRTELLKKLNELLEAPGELEMENYLDDFIARFQKSGLLDIE
jgi:PqqD family protein of HPr-rel-A system